MPLRSRRLTRLYTSSTFVWSMTSNPSGLCREAASLAKNRLVETPMEQDIHSPISVRKRRLISFPMSTTEPLKRQSVWVRSITASSIDLGGHVWGVVPEDFAEFLMDVAVFGRV